MSAAAGPGQGLPRWAALGLLPLVNLLAAFAASGLLVWMIGENPVGSGPAPGLGRIRNR